MLGSVESLRSWAPALDINQLAGKLGWKGTVPDDGWLSIDSNRPNQSKPSGGSDVWYTIGTFAATAVTTTAVWIGVRSAYSMITWRQSLRDAETGGPAAGPNPLPLLGNMLQLRKNYYKTLYEHVSEPASVFWVLSTPFVVINSAETSSRVLGGAGGLYMKPKYFGYRSKPVQTAVSVQQAQVVAESATYDPHGDSSRVALKNMIKSSFTDIKQSMVLLMEQLSFESIEVANPNRNVLQTVREGIIGLNLQVLFGIPHEGREKETKRIADMIGFAGTEFARRMVNPLKILADLPGNIRYFRDVIGLIKLGRQLCTALDESMSTIKKEVSGVVGAMGGNKAGLGWVHAWVGKVGKIGKLGKVVGLLMASSQTVPLTAVWMLYLIANDQEVQGRLKDELLRMGIFSVNDIKFEDLEKLTVAEAVIKETLRLYPPFPLIQREAQDDDVLGGITIPKGTPVYVVPWLLHRNPEYWSDPHDFKPSRFLDCNSQYGDAKSSWVYVPFGRGSRMCAGSRLAMAELKVLLATAVLHYNLDTSNSSKNAGCTFPPLGMVPNGVDIRVQKLSF